MTVKSLLATSLFIAVYAAPFVGQSAHKMPNIAEAAAETPAPNQDNVTHIPAMTESSDSSWVKPATAADIQTAISLERLKESKAKIQLQLQSNLASNEGCFTLRSYGFTPDDLKSSDPRPSTSTTCTPASAGKTKEAKAAVLVR